MELLIGWGRYLCVGYVPALPLMGRDRVGVHDTRHFALRIKQEKINWRFGRSEVSCAFANAYVR